MSDWTVGIAIDQMVTLLRARAFVVTNSIQVFDGWPGEMAEITCIWIGDAESSDEIAGFRGGAVQVVNEVYDLDVYAECTRPGKTTKEVRDTVIQVGGEVEKLIKEDPRLSTDLLSVRVARKRLVQLPTQDGRQALNRIQVKVTARS